MNKTACDLKKYMCFIFLLGKSSHSHGMEEFVTKPNAFAVE